MKFNEMTYTRPDIGALLARCKKLAAKAGAGSLVPITGFANAVVSAAIEFKAEGRVLGTGAKMFTIAGPVIVYGTLAAVVYGAVLWVLHPHHLLFCTVYRSAVEKQGEGWRTK